jgi:hypothetical protein
VSDDGRHGSCGSFQHPRPLPVGCVRDVFGRFNAAY